MGADFISYIMFGPAELDPKAVVAARGRAHNTVSVLRDFLAVHDEDLDAMDWSPLFQVLPEMTDVDEYDLGHMAQMDAEDINKTVDAFEAMWGGNFRDTACRYLPNPTPGGIEKVVVAGDVTWGDEPDGAGYQAMKWAELLGLMETLGVC